MMIRSGDFSFSSDRLNNLVETLVKLGEIRPAVAAEAKTVAAYGGEIMQGRAMTERNIDIGKGEDFGEAFDARNYTGKGLAGIRAAEKFPVPARKRLRFTPDIDPQILRLLSRSLGSNEGSRLFRLVRNEAIEQGVIPKTRVTRGTVRAEIKSMRGGRETKEPRIKGRTMRSIIAKQKAEERRLGATGGRPAYDTQVRKFEPKGVTVSTVETEFEGSGRGIPLVSEALAAAGGESPEVRLRRATAKAIQRQARAASPVPLEGARGATQRDDPSEERSANRKARFTQRFLRNLLATGQLDKSQEKQIRDALKAEKSIVGRSLDAGARRVNSLVDRILSAPKAVRDRLRRLASSKSPEFKAELQRLVRAYQADKALRERETDKAEYVERRYGRRVRGFKTARENEVIHAPKREPKPQDPKDPDTLRRQAERLRGEEAISREARTVGVERLRRLGRIRERPSGRAVLKAGMSPRILEQPVELPPARRTVSMSEAGIPVPRTPPVTGGFDPAELIEFMRNRAATLQGYSPEEMQRFMASIDALEANMRARAAAVAPLEAARVARMAEEASRVPEVKPAQRARSIIRGTNPAAVLRALAARRRR